MPFNEALAVLLVREPRSGLAKTRLASRLGEEKALQWYRDLLVRLGRELPGAKGVRVVAAVTPESAMDRMMRLLPTLTLWVQEGAGLGERIHRVLQRGIDEGFLKVLVMASDVPEIGPADLEAASEALDRRDVVIGPCPDGGYYLLGVRGRVPDLFEGVAWGSDTVLLKTMALAGRQGIVPELLRTLADVDTLEDWLQIQDDGMMRPATKGC